MKKYVLFASAILAFASCASDSFTGTDEAGRVAQGEKPISFGFDVPTPTRAETTGAAAATLLGNQFIVYGEKGETADGAAPVTDGSTGHQLVFKNYVVKYTASTAYTTTSNTKNWEYVGLTQGYGTNVDPQAGETQTIKYWDYSATNYVFTAFSAKEEDLNSGKVQVTKVTAKTDVNQVYDKGYTVTLAAGADLSKLYFSDRQVIDHGTGTDRNAANAYGGNVTFTFRNSLTQVRAGIYETIPGYQVTAIKFYVTGNAEAKNGTTPAFGVIAPNVGGNNFEGTINVTYYDNSVAATENHPKLKITPAAGLAKTDLILGTNPNTVSKTNPLGTTATAPTWDTDGGAFTPVLPQIDNTTNMQLKVDYTLYNDVTKETINITGKTAEVPAQYLAWKPNFKYTYLFKITDSDLYPITFDAVVIEAENGEVEYITTVSEPSITTFGVKDSKYVHGGSEYADGSDIYATIKDGTSVVDPNLGTNVNLYKDITAGATEASLAEAIAEVSAKTHSVAFTLDNSIGTKVTSVPTETGSTTTINAVKMAGLAPGIYAVEYVKTARTYKAQAVTYETQAEYDAAFAAVNLYTDSGTSTAAVAGSWSDSNKTFYKKVVDNVGVYAYKVIRVQ